MCFEVLFLIVSGNKFNNTKQTGEKNARTLFNSSVVSGLFFPLHAAKQKNTMNIDRMTYARLCQKQAINLIFEN